MLPDDVGKRGPAWVIREYRHVLRMQWEATVDAINATEAGVSRALSVALGGKRPKPLPTFDELMQRQTRERLPRESRLPAWMLIYEQVNADKIPKCG